MKSFITLNIINFTNMARREEWSFTGYEESFIIIKLIWHSYLVLNLDNYAHKLLLRLILHMHHRHRRLDAGSIVCPHEDWGSHCSHLVTTGSSHRDYSEVPAPSIDRSLLKYMCKPLLKLVIKRGKKERMKSSTRPCLIKYYLPISDVARRARLDRFGLAPT